MVIITMMIRIIILLTITKEMTIIIKARGALSAHKEIFTAEEFH